MNVAIYARVSKADKDDPNSVPVQLAACRERAAAEGWDVVGEFVDEGISAWDPRKTRPAYEEMLADLEAGRFDAPLARDDERLLRQDKEGARWLELHVSGRVRHLKYVDIGDVDLSRAADRKRFKEMVAAAVYYSDRISEKVRPALDAKAARGEWSGGGRRPFGFRVVPDESRPPRSNGRPFYRLDPDPREADLVRAAARAVIGGASLHSVVVAWNDGPEPARKDSGSRWTLMDVRRVLTSEQVAGTRGGVRGTWDAILKEDERALLLAVLDDPARRRGPRAERQVRRWALAGSVYCGLCGSRLDGRTQTRRLASGATSERRQYVCNSANGGCSRIGVDAPRLERLVLAAALELPEPVDEGGAGPAAPSEREAEVLAEMRGLEERKAALSGDLADPAVDRAATHRAIAALNGTLKELRSEVAAAAARPRRGRRTYLATLDAPDDFLAGRISELPDPWPAAAADLLASLGARATVGPASARGARFEPSRVDITWRASGDRVVGRA